MKCETMVGAELVRYDISRHQKKSGDQSFDEQHSDPRDDEITEK